VIGGALGFFRAQSKGFALGSDRMNMLQNLRYAANVLEKDLRTVGSNVPDNQPFIIYAGTDVFAFSADVVTNVPDDPFSVYFDADAPGGAVSALTLADRITIPQTSFVYPQVDFVDPGGINSAAETIIFYFSLDAGTPRADDYVLHRQVNNLPPEIVARGLLQTAGTQFFSYERLVTPIAAPAFVTTVPVAQLPLMHTDPQHLSTTDVGPAAVVDSIRGVRVNFTATNGLEGPAESRRTISRLVNLPNAGLATRRVCGDEPFGVNNLSAVRQAVPGGWVVQLSWDPSDDETGGEQDVVRYVIWRREGATLAWGDPFLSIPAGAPTYSYTDGEVTSGGRYTYQFAAQDCTPQLSAPQQTVLVVIP
jgi:hypothetical protein